MDDHVVSMPAKVEIQIGFRRLRKLQTPVFAQRQLEWCEVAQMFSKECLRVRNHDFYPEFELVEQERP